MRRQRSTALSWLAAAVRRRDDGQVAVIFAMILLVLVSVVALSIDGGFILAERRQTQNAADAAALAAAKAAMDGRPSGEVLAAARDYAARNANVPVGNVTVSWPPATGAFAGRAGYIQVSIHKEVNRYFVGAVYNGPWEVSASAVAGIEPEGFDAALLALNSNAGGIDTSGSTRIEVIGGSVVSNYNIHTSGSTTILASQYVVANDGFNTSGSTTIDGGDGEKPNGAEVPDPLLNKISPPNLPSFPSDPVADVTPSNGTCRTYSPWTNPVTYTVTSATYTGNGSCVNIQNIPNGQTMQLTGGQFRFRNGAGISVGGGNSGHIVLRSGTYNFENGGAITVGGSTPTFELEQGNYSFTGGSGGINIGGSAPNNTIGGGNLYFADGASIRTGGSNRLTINPGTYIFDGGPGLVMTGSDQLHFNSGTYTLYFRNGADLSFSGSSRITTSGNVYVRAYFYGGSQWSDLTMSGSTNFNIPAGEYYFDHGRFLNSGSSLITGSDVFLYFKNDSYLSSTGSASFGFTAPTNTIYPGYYPGVFMYSDRANTASFEWHGSTSSTSRGTVYLPSSPVRFGGSSTGKQFYGQFIADRFITSGSTGLTIEFVEYVQTEIPKVYLVE